MSLCLLVLLTLTSIAVSWGIDLRGLELIKIGNKLLNMRGKQRVNSSIIHQGPGGGVEVKKHTNSVGKYVRDYGLRGVETNKQIKSNGTSAKLLRKHDGVVKMDKRTTSAGSSIDRNEIGSLRRHDGGLIGFTTMNHFGVSSVLPIPGGYYGGILSHPQVIPTSISAKISLHMPSFAVNTYRGYYAGYYPGSIGYEYSYSFSQ